MNTFYHGDCKFVMEHDIPAESIDLIYLDPPFYTGQVQKGTAKWHPEAMEISYDDSKKFWAEKGLHRTAPEWMKYIARKNNERAAFAAYLYYMMERLELCKKVLKQTGSIYLHCDWRASHYLKMIMDEIFGESSFRNEIVWHYKRWTAASKTFQRMHDTLLLYTKTSHWIFNKQYQPFSEKTVIAPYKRKIEGGRAVQDKSRPMERNPEKGIAMHDVWNIAFIHPVSKERAGYPTQKPEALLKRIIEASSNEGDLVLDPFCGCGTTVIVASKLGRRFIGIDIDTSERKEGKLPTAFEVIKNRAHELFNLTHYISRDLGEVKEMKPLDFQGWVNEFYSAMRANKDKGVDGITKDGTPIQTKAWSYKVDDSTIRQFAIDIQMHREVPQPVKKAIFVSQSGFANNARAAADEIRAKFGIGIELKRPEDLLKIEEDNASL